MADVRNETADARTTRDDFIPKEHYVCPEFAKREARDFWPRVWQMVCRMEDIPARGSFLTYEILQYSVVLVRAEGDCVNAFHNVCPHRGNQIAHGTGSINKLTCRFHGWQWNLQGGLERIKEREDWNGCSHMTDSDLNLKPIRTGVWAGFVFISLDPDGESFEEFIAPAPQYLDCLEFDRMRLTWSKTVPLKANWKTAMESFMESYHLIDTHPQTLPFLDGISVSYEHGKHGRHGYPNARPFGSPAPRHSAEVPTDIRQGYVDGMLALADQISGSVTSYRSANAVRRMMDEVPATATPLEVQLSGLRFMAEAAIADGSGFPALTPEQAQYLGVDWNIFPNMVLVFSLDSTLVMRARPVSADDPGACVFDMWALLRQPPGKELTPERAYYPDWRASRDKIPYLLAQDLSNIETIQKGMASPAFAGSRTNPVQERQISNHHKVLERYLAM